MKPKIHIKSIDLCDAFHSGMALAAYEDGEIVCCFQYKDDGSIYNLEFLSSSFCEPIEIPNHERFVAEASITKLVEEKLYHAQD